MLSDHRISHVSIILPTYNRGDLISRAIDSVLAQTYPNWELIIWDDGSTDNSRNLIASYTDKRIKYHFERNHGAAYARNRALEKSNGEYIAFMDSDDEWVKEKLAWQVRVTEAWPRIDALFGNFTNINLVRGEEGDGFTQNKSSLEHLSTDTLENRVYLIRSGMPESLALGNFIATDTMLLRREVLTRTGAFNEELRNSMDFELWWRMGLVGVRFAYFDKLLMKRYKPADSLSSPGVQSGLNTLKALDICKENSLTIAAVYHLPYLDKLYRNTWQNMITAYGNEKNLKKAFASFVNSMRYGFRPGAVRLLAEALITSIWGKHGN